MEADITTANLLKLKSLSQSNVILLEHHVTGIHPFEIQLSNKAYKIFTFLTNNKFVKAQITQMSPIQYTFHLCGALGVYIYEEINGTSMSYEPYCNLTEFDALSGDTFSFYSHGKSLKVIAYHFNPGKEHIFTTSIKVMNSKCQGIANICFLFTRLTLIRYLSGLLFCGSCVLNQTKQANKSVVACSNEQPVDISYLKHLDISPLQLWQFQSTALAVIAFYIEWAPNPVFVVTSNGTPRCP